MTRWFRLNGRECANEIHAIVDSLASAYSWRRIQDEEIRRRIEPATHVRDIDGPEQLVRRTKALAESVQADIVGRQRPRPTAMTSGADWQTRRRAKRLDKFVTGVLSQTHGGYADAWELFADVLLDACYSSCGTGVIKVTADGEANKICLERVLARDIYVDPREGKLGNPRNYFQRSAWDKDLLIEIFPDQTQAIERATPVDDSELTLTNKSLGERHRAVEQVWVVEAWRVARGSNVGRHVISIEGHVLLDEEWESESPPLIFLRWTRARESFWGMSLADEIRELENEFNDALVRMSDSVCLRAGRRLYYREGSLDAEDLTANDTEVHVPIKDDGPFPQVEQPPILSSGEVELARWIYSLTSDVTGIAEMLQTGNKPGGVTAASALRTLRDTGSRRQALRVTAYENAFQQAYERIVDAARRLASEDENFYADWPGRGFLERINWSDADLSRDQYYVSIESSSMLTEEPGGRLQLLQELFSSGLIDGETFQRNLDSPDLEQIFSRSNAEFEWLEVLIDQMLDWDERSDDALPDHLTAPEGFLKNIPGAMVQFGSAYFEARKQGAPEANLDLLRDYIVELEEMDRARKAAAMPPPQVPPSMPGVAPIPPPMPLNAA